MMESRPKMASWTGFPSQLEGFDSPSPLQSFSGQNSPNQAHDGPNSLGSSLHNFRHNFTIAADAILKRLVAWMAPRRWWMAAIVTSAKNLYSSHDLVVITTGPRPWAALPLGHPVVSDGKAVCAMTRASRYVVAGVLMLVCSGAAFAQEEPDILTRQIIVQGSIGQPGREVVFLNCFNPDQVASTVTASFVGRGGSFSVFHSFDVDVDASINLRSVPGMPTAANFSMDVTVDTADGRASSLTCDLTWYTFVPSTAPGTPGTYREVESRTAVIRRSPKR